MYKKILSVVLLVYATVGTGWLDLLDFPSPKPPAAEILTIDKPDQDVIDRVSIFSDIVTDPDDRAKLAIFNHEFAKRVTEYDATSQDVNDVYSIAGKMFFEKSLVDKYDGLSEEIVKLMEEIIGETNHSLDQVEKDQLNEYFIGISWVLIQKG